MYVRVYIYPKSVLLCYINFINMLTSFTSLLIFFCAGRPLYHQGCQPEYKPHRFSLLVAS